MRYRVVSDGRKCHLQELQDTFFGKEYVSIASFHKACQKRLEEAAELLNGCVTITKIQNDGKRP